MSRSSKTLAALLGALVAFACSDRSGPDPFAGPDAGAGGGGGVAGESQGGEGGEDVPLGGPCLDDEQCDDELDCTRDRCDGRLARCRYQANDSDCDDGVYCNGNETCHPALGCRAAAVLSCSDANTCTIDRCVEETRSCEYELRDADGDGDPARSCGGSDCREDDPLISGTSRERCGNGQDDDCDGTSDESDCVAPAHDRCSSALLVETPGTYQLSLAGTRADYSFSCAGALDGAAVRDAVVAVVVPDGEPRDVDVLAFVESGSLLLAVGDRCGNAAGELACEAGLATAGEAGVARLVIRAREPGPLAVVIAGTAETDVTVRVAFRESTPAPTHETCGAALALEPGVVEHVRLASLQTDLESACGARTGELVYFFELAERRDVRLRAASLDAFGEPVISLRNAACTRARDELSCRAASPTELFARDLAPGRYHVAVAGTGPSDVELVLETQPPSEPPLDEGCREPPLAEPGVTAEVPLIDHVDAIQVGCLVGAPDAARALELTERSDVLVVQTGSDGDRGAAAVLEAPCATPADLFACESSDEWPVRALARGVGPGSMRAVVETAGGTPTTITLFSRPAREAVLVHRADDCVSALEIPETGGRFQGNTQNAFADYDASCDYGGQLVGGAPDQLLRLELSSRRRMIFDLKESEYDTLLVVREASSCPGSEIARACAPGYVTAKSFLDLDLEAGSYYVQVDGYDGSSGRWTLDVFGAEL